MSSEIQKENQQETSGALGRFLRRFWRELGLAALFFALVYVAMPETARVYVRRGASVALENWWVLFAALFGTLLLGGVAKWILRATRGEAKESMHGRRAVATLALSALLAAASVYAAFYVAQTFQLAQLATFLGLSVLGLIIFTVVDATILKDFDTVRELKDRNLAVAGYYLAVSILLLAAAVASL